MWTDLPKLRLWAQKQGNTFVQYLIVIYIIQMCITVDNSSLCFFPWLISEACQTSSTSARVVFKWLYLAWPADSQLEITTSLTSEICHWCCNVVISKAHRMPFECFQFFDMNTLWLSTTPIGVLVISIRPEINYLKWRVIRPAIYSCKELAQWNALNSYR